MGQSTGEFSLAHNLIFADFVKAIYGFRISFQSFKAAAATCA